MGAETVLLDCTQSAPRSDTSSPDPSSISPALFAWGKDARPVNDLMLLGDLKAETQATGRFADYFDLDTKSESSAGIYTEQPHPTPLPLFDATHCEQSELRGESPSQYSEGLNLDVVLSRPLTPIVHVAVATVHYPYSIDRPYNVLHVCECADCVALVDSQVGGLRGNSRSPPSTTFVNRVLSSQISPQDDEACRCCCCNNTCAPGDHAAPLSKGATAPSFRRPAAPVMAIPPALVSSMAGRSIVETRRPYITPFMPPPPTPLVAQTLLAEGSGLDGAVLFRRMLARWYAKLQQVQLMWTGAVEVCPSPPTTDSDFALEQWGQMVTCWWHAHFAHLQKRHKPYYYTRYH